MFVFEKKQHLLVTFVASSRPALLNLYNGAVDSLHLKEIKNEVPNSALRPKKLV